VFVYEYPHAWTEFRSAMCIVDLEDIDLVD